MLKPERPASRAIDEELALPFEQGPVSRVSSG